MTCTCPTPGFCPVYQRLMPERLWQICRGEVLTPEKCQSYRDNWAGMAKGGGPGTELTRLFHQLDATPSEGCQCAQFALKMDAWGPDGCESNRAEIIAYLQKSYAGTSWPIRIKAGVNAAVNRLPMTLDGLLSLAIERSRLPP